MVAVVKMGDRFVAQVTYHEREIAKRAGFRWDSTLKQWWTSDPRIAARLSDAPSVVEAKAELQRAVELSKAHDAHDDRIVEPPSPLNYLPFQRAAISFALDRKNVLFGDSMGLGKTWEAIGVINSDRSINKILIICPKSLKLNWQNELERVLARRFEIHIAESKELADDFRLKRHILIINYDIVKRYKEELVAHDWDCLILDECHYVKSESAQRTRAILGKGKQELPIKATRKMFLTGTPIPNRPMEGWTVFHALNPKDFPSWWEYARRYCNAHHNGFGLDTSGAAHLDELQLKLRSSIMVRRKKEDVLKELPLKRRVVIEIPPGIAAKLVSNESKAAAAFDNHIMELKAAVELAKAQGPEEYEAAVHALHDATSAAFQELSRLRHDTAVAKVPYVLSFLEDALEEEAKIVVFAWHHDVIDPIVSHFGRAAVHLTGDDKLADRQAAVDRFQSDPSCKLFVGSITAAGVGITLTAASHVVFVELDWVPGNMTQAEDRLHRIGQRYMVLVQHLVFNGSLDAKMAKKLIEKQRIIDKALDEKLPADESGEILWPNEEEITTQTTRRKEIEKVAATLRKSDISLIHTCLRLLADADSDHASQLNGAGYSKVDTILGHSLAERSELSAKQAALGLRLCAKYRRQLPQQYRDELGLEEK